MPRSADHGQTPLVDSERASRCECASELAGQRPPLLLLLARSRGFTFLESTSLIATRHTPPRPRRLDRVLHHTQPRLLPSVSGHDTGRRSSPARTQSQRSLCPRPTNTRLCQSPALQPPSSSSSFPPGPAPPRPGQVPRAPARSQQGPSEVPAEGTATQHRLTPQ